MLVALLTAYLMAGGSGIGGSLFTPQAVKRIVEEVEATVGEEARAREAEETLRELRSAIRSFESDLDRSDKRLTKLFQDHDPRAEEMAAELDELDASWTAAQQRAIELRFRLKQTLTEEEWNRLFGAAPPAPEEPEEGAPPETR